LPVYNSTFFVSCQHLILTFFKKIEKFKKLTFLHIFLIVFLLLLDKQAKKLYNTR